MGLSDWLVVVVVLIEPMLCCALIVSELYATNSELQNEWRSRGVSRGDCLLGVVECSGVTHIFTLTLSYSVVNRLHFAGRILCDKRVKRRLLLKEYFPFFKRA